MHGILSLEEPSNTFKRGFSGQQRGRGWGGGALASLTFGKDDICILSMRYVGRINFKIFWTPPLLVFRPPIPLKSGSTAYKSRKKSQLWGEKNIKSIWLFVCFHIPFENIRDYEAKACKCVYHPRPNRTNELSVLTRISTDNKVAVRICAHGSHCRCLSPSNCAYLW